MPGCFLSVRQVLALTFLLAFSTAYPGAQTHGGSLPAFASPETLEYTIEWRLITAGKAKLRIQPVGTGDPRWEAKVHLETAGLVSKLYKLDDNYTVALEKQFCAATSSLDAEEGKKHRDTKVTYDYQRGRAIYVERDLLKNATVQTKETEIPSCVSDVIGGLYKLRTMPLEPGQSVLLPTSDGKRTAQVKIEAQERENIKTPLGSFKTIRCEAFLFNGVIYARKASMQVWFSDDARHLPVRIRARMSFPVGSITLELEKEEHS